MVASRDRNRGSCSGWFLVAGGVGVAEAAGALVVAAGDSPVGPPHPVFDHDVVVAAEGPEVDVVGGSTLSPRDPVIEVTVRGGGATAGKHTP
jgi:hypothetical protein